MLGDVETYQFEKLSIGAHRMMWSYLTNGVEAPLYSCQNRTKDATLPMISDQLACWNRLERRLWASLPRKWCIWFDSISFSCRSMRTWLVELALRAMAQIQATHGDRKSPICGLWGCPSKWPAPGPSQLLTTLKTPIPPSWREESLQMGHLGGETSKNVLFSPAQKNGKMFTHL